MATTAINQLDSQFAMAEEERVRPIAMMIGPVTMGGKKRMTFFTPKDLNRAARITYINPAMATPKQAYGRSAGSPFGAMAAYPPIKAKELPRKAGTLRPVIKWNSSVPRPANSSVVATSRPVSAGTRTVAPNMANMCWMPRISIFGVPRERAS